MNEHTFASAITESYRIHKRKPADYYPTPPDVTHALMRHLNLPRSTVIWEPACGDGSMSKVLEQYVDSVTSTDLRRDSGYGREETDFLNPDVSFECDWIITNPPFSHAAEFIEKSLQITPNVAMLLKATFWHARKRLSLFQQTLPSAILPLTWRPSFLEKERGSSPLMDVMWVVWSQDVASIGYCPLPRPARMSEETPTPTLDDLLR